MSEKVYTIKEIKARIILIKKLIEEHNNEILKRKKKLESND